MDKLIELTSSDKLEVENEEMVFLAVKRWYSERPEERNENFHKVSSCSFMLKIRSPKILYKGVLISGGKLEPFFAPKFR